MEVFDDVKSDEIEVFVDGKEVSVEVDYIIYVDRVDDEFGVIYDFVSEITKLVCLEPEKVGSDIEKLYDKVSDKLEDSYNSGCSSFSIAEHKSMLQRNAKEMRYGQMAERYKDSI